MTIFLENGSLKLRITYGWIQILLLTHYYSQTTSFFKWKTITEIFVSIKKNVKRVILKCLYKTRVKRSGSSQSGVKRPTDRTKWSILTIQALIRTRCGTIKEILNKKQGKKQRWISIKSRQCWCCCMLVKRGQWTRNIWQGFRLQK